MMSKQDRQRVDEIRARVESEHVPQETMTIGAGYKTGLTEEQLKHEKDIQLDGGTAKVDNDDVPEGQGFALAQFLANAAPDIRFLLSKMPERPAFDFDVSSEVSLDTLREELLPLLQNQESRCLFDIRGPGGGNTNVLIYTQDEEDKGRIEEYVRKHNLAP